MSWFILQTYLHLPPCWVCGRKISLLFSKLKPFCIPAIWYTHLRYHTYPAPIIPPAAISSCVPLSSSFTRSTVCSLVTQAKNNIFKQNLRYGLISSILSGFEPRTVLRFYQIGVGGRICQLSFQLWWRVVLRIWYPNCFSECCGV